MFRAATIPPGPAAPSGTVTTVPLEYQETGYRFLFRHVTVECRLAPFPKEPAAASGNIVRGVLKFGDNPSNAIPFLWQGGAKKLFLDLNRNQDLTDDADGVFPARGRVRQNRLPSPGVHEHPPVVSGNVRQRADAGGPALCFDRSGDPGERCRR